MREERLLWLHIVSLENCTLSKEGMLKVHIAQWDPEKLSVPSSKSLTQWAMVQGCLSRRDWRPYFTRAPRPRFIIPRRCFHSDVLRTFVLCIAATMLQKLICSVVWCCSRTDKSLGRTRMLQEKLLTGRCPSDECDRDGDPSAHLLVPSRRSSATDVTTGCGRDLDSPVWDVWCNTREERNNKKVLTKLAERKCWHTQGWKCWHIQRVVPTTAAPLCHTIAFRQDIYIGANTYTPHRARTEHIHSARDHAQIVLAATVQCAR